MHGYPAQTLAKILLERREGEKYKAHEPQETLEAFTFPYCRGSKNGISNTTNCALIVFR